MPEIIKDIIIDIFYTRETWVAIIGGILGAIVGGFISFLVQLHSIIYNKKISDEKEYLRKKSSAYVVLTKIQKCYSNIFYTHTYFEECKAKAIAKNTPGIAQVFTPMLHKFEEISVSEIEISVFSELEEVELLQDYMESIEFNNTINLVISKLTDFRTEMESLMTPVSLNGLTVTMDFKEGEKMKVEFIANKIDNLFSEYYNQASFMKPKSKETMEKILGSFNKKLNLGKKFEDRIVESLHH